MRIRGLIYLDLMRLYFLKVLGNLWESLERESEYQVNRKNRESLIDDIF
jgi:hypothetical protein